MEIYCRKACSVCSNESRNCKDLKSGIDSYFAAFFVKLRVLSHVLVNS